MTTQLCYASTLYGAATLAAAIDAGALGPADRRVLLCSGNAAIPEITPSLQQVAGFDAVARRFDDVRSLNDTLFPLHPADWSPREKELPAWERLLRGAWELGDGPLRLVVESIQVDPARSLGRVFAEAPIDVYADGLMSYGPTRNRLPAPLGARIETLHHLDLVPGLRPLLLSEWDVVPRPVAREDFRAVLAEITAGSPVPELGDEPVAVLLGQYLSALHLLTPAEEEQLHLEMLRAAVRRGHRRVVFKPHPTAADALAGPLLTEAGRLGAEVTVIEQPMLAEALYDRLPVGLVVGCFSTALFTAPWLYDVPAGRVGTGPLLQRLTPYQNSNRIPLTLVDALLPDLGETASPPRSRGDDGVDGLVTAVGYAMQPAWQQGHRATATSFLARNADWAGRYVTRRRLTALDLPGGRPEPGRLSPRRARRRLGTAYREVRRRTGRAGRALLGSDD